MMAPSTSSYSLAPKSVPTSASCFARPASGDLTAKFSVLNVNRKESAIGVDLCAVFR